MFATRIALKFETIVTQARSITMLNRKCPSGFENDGEACKLGSQR